MKSERNCDYCGKKYIAKTDKSKYCSTAHRVRAYEKRHGIESPGFVKKQPSVKKAVFKPLQTVKAQKTDSAIAGNPFALNTLTKLQSDRNFYLQSLFQLQKDVFPYVTVGGAFVGSQIFGKENRLAGMVLGGIAGYMVDKKLQTNRADEIERMRESCLQKIKEIDKQISLLQVEVTVPKKTEEILSPGGLVLSGSDVIKQDIPVYNFSEPYSSFIGNPTQNFSAIVYGLPKSGKSNFSIQFASYLARQFGKVFYVASEEGLRSRTLIDKVKYNLADNREIFFSGSRDIEEVKRQINEKDYKFIFFDSLNTLHITNDQLQAIKRQFPGKAFVSVLQSTKDGAFKGGQEFAHNCDVVIKIDSGVASQVGRFNTPSELRIFN